VRKKGGDGSTSDGNLSELTDAMRRRRRQGKDNDLIWINYAVELPP